MNTIITSILLLFPLIIIVYYMSTDCKQVSTHSTRKIPNKSPTITENLVKPLSPLVNREQKRPKPYLNPKNGCEVYPGLYLGNAAFASDVELLTGLGITHIVNCAKEVPDYFKGDFNFQYLHLMLHDIPNENITRFFELSRNFIKESLDNRKIVLVHCWAGISRSVTVVIYYLVNTLGISVKDALAMIRKSRPVANPNPGFIKQLGYIV